MGILDEFFSFRPLYIIYCYFNTYWYFKFVDSELTSNKTNLLLLSLTIHIADVDGRIFLLSSYKKI
jgi:hypothetical protein